MNYIQLMLTIFMLNQSLLITQSLPLLSMNNNNTSPSFNKIMKSQTNMIKISHDMFSQIQQIPLAPSISDAINTLFVQGLGLPTHIVNNIKKIYGLLQSSLQFDYQEEKNTHLLLNEITLPMLKTSTFWQDFIKLQIISSFDYELSLLNQVHKNQIKMFSYIPTFEVAYYSDDYTHVRMSGEMVRIFLVLTDLVRNRLLKESTDWRSLDRQKMYDTIKEFSQKSQFYYAYSILNSLPQEPVNISQSFLNTDNTIQYCFQQIITLNTQTNLYEITHDYQPFFIFNAQQNLQFTPIGSVLFSINTENNNNTITTISKNTIFEQLFEQDQNGSLIPTQLYLKLMTFLGIKSLHTEFDYLFNSANLEDTFQILANNKHIINQMPSLILYQPEDYLYLSDINMAKNYFKNSETSHKNTTIQSCHKVWHDVGHAFKKCGEDIKHGFDEIGDAFKDFGYLVKDLCVGLYYISGIACLVQHIPYSEAQKLSVRAIHSAMQHLSAIASDLSKCINDLVAAAESAIQGVTSCIAAALNTIDPNLGTDLMGLVDVACDTLLNAFGQTINFSVQMAVDVAKLTVDGIMAITNTILAVINSAVGGSNSWGSIGSSWKSFGKDISETVLNAMTLAVKFTGMILNGIMQFIAYAVGAIVDCIAIVAAAVTTALTFGAVSYKSVDAAVQQHRAVISDAIVTAVLVAITIASFGSLTEVTGPMLALSIAGAAMGVQSIVMMTIGLAGSIQSDADTNAIRHEQKEYTQRFAEYVKDNTTFMINTQNDSVVSFATSLYCEEANRERSLVHYQNFLNQIFNNTVLSTGNSLGLFYANRFQQTSDGNIIQGDLGSSYGIQTNRYALAPSQGFSIYNQERKSFSQEIAAFPTIISPAKNIKDSPTKAYWFEQKDFANIPIQSSPQIIEVRFKIIYDNNGPIMIGIYQTEKYLDENQLLIAYQNLESAQTNGTVSNTDPLWEKVEHINRELVNYDYQAKIFTIVRKSYDSDPYITLYQHGLGFMKDIAIPITLNLGDWYKMKTIITPINSQESTLQAKCWNEKESEPTNWQINQQVMTATPFIIDKHQPIKYNGSMGVVSSGASIEYQILQPTTTPSIAPQRALKNSQLTQNGALQQTVFGNQNMPTLETDRSKAWYQQIEQLKTITFGNMTLTAIDQDLIMNNQFIYTSTTNLLDNNHQDYFVFVENPGTTAQKIGISPTKEPQLLASLVTGKTYDTNNNQNISCNNIMHNFQKSYGALPQQIITKIRQEALTYFSSVQGPFTFSNITIELNKSSMTNFLNIYTGKSLTKELNSAKDYFIMVTYADTGILTYGQTLIPGDTHSRINGFASLITGIVYGMFNQQNTATSIPESTTIGNITLQPISTIQASYIFNEITNTLPTNILQIITKSRKLYKATVKEETTVKKALTTIESAQSIINITNTTIAGATSFNALSTSALGQSINTTTSTLGTINSAITQLQLLLNTQPINNNMIDEYTNKLNILIQQLTDQNNTLNGLIAIQPITENNFTGNSTNTAYSNSSSITSYNSQGNNFTF